MIFNNEEYFYLKGKETGEALDLKKTLKWITIAMPYDDFKKLAKLSFINKRVDGDVIYEFEYSYHTPPERDTPRKRENYLKFLAFKLYQNLTTEGIELNDGNSITDN